MKKGKLTLTYDVHSYDGLELVEESYEFEKDFHVPHIEGSKNFMLYIDDQLAAIINYNNFIKLKVDEVPDNSDEEKKTTQLD